MTPRLWMERIYYSDGLKEQWEGTPERDVWNFRTTKRTVRRKIRSFPSSNRTAEPAEPIRTEQFGQIQASVLDADASVHTEYVCKVSPVRNCARLDATEELL